MSETKYKWWISRIEHNLFLYDWCRIDHFRGLVAFWQVPSHEETAINGQWVQVPIHHFINTLLKRFPNLPLIGEDLGLITADVREIMYQYNIPGMKVLQFAFDSSLPQNPYAPHNHVENCIVYTGTHDNNTTCGWFENETDDEIKNRIQRYFGRSITSKDIHWEFIRAAMRSIASLVVIPMQDLLGLDHTARMNTPATANKNWEWRLEANQITDELKHELRGMTEIFGRA
jgi:4-alpha-glucanotransferase